MLGLECGELHVRGEVVAGVGVHEGVVAAEHGGVVEREGVERGDDARIRGQRGDEGGVVLSAPQRGVDVVDDGVHAVVGVPRTGVRGEEPLVDGQVVGLQVGAVGQDDGVAQHVAVVRGDVGGLRVGEEGVEGVLDVRGQRRVIGADVRRVVVLDVVPGPQVQDELPDPGRVGAGVVRRQALVRLGDGDHLGLLEHLLRVAAGERKQRVDAVGGRVLDVGGQRRAGQAAESGRGARLRSGGPGGPAAGAGLRGAGRGLRHERPPRRELVGAEAAVLDGGRVGAADDGAQGRGFGRAVRTGGGPDGGRGTGRGSGS
jgi:hypothetical protein